MLNVSHRYTEWEVYWRVGGGIVGYVWATNSREAEYLALNLFGELAAVKPFIPFKP
jgi:hypothetical protein